MYCVMSRNPCKNKMTNNQTNQILYPLSTNQRNPYINTPTRTHLFRKTPFKTPRNPHKILIKMLQINPHINHPPPFSRIQLHWCCALILWAPEWGHRTRTSLGSAAGGSIHTAGTGPIHWITISIVNILRIIKIPLCIKSAFVAVFRGDFDAFVYW